MYLSDFRCKENTQLYVPPQKKLLNFDYSDGGRAEKYLLRILQEAQDVSSDSEELLTKIKDWPSYYHLGPGRANILRVLKLNSSSKVLELGSGCGAISRYLGENFKFVDGVEGSFNRAQIANERCKGLNNVRFFCSDINDITFQLSYDIVTLIGVLEYAPLYIAKPRYEACLSLLNQAKTALKNDGALVIAIENKIGMKYWSGSAEDHTGRFYDGIHGYPHEKTVLTFSKSEMQKLLQDAGFKHIHFYHCFPDYKFASTIFSDVGQDEELYLHNWIEVPFRNYSGLRKHILHEGLALRSLSKAGLLREFANSFTVVASQHDSNAALKPDWIAKKITGFPRRKEYRCITTLKTEPEMYIEKIRTCISESPSKSTQQNIAVNHVEEESPWYPGDLLVFEVYESFFDDNFRSRMKELLEIFFQYLIKNFATGNSDEEGYTMLKGNSIDLRFGNIVRMGQCLLPIDAEWVAANEIPADYVLFRCIRNDIIDTQYPGIKTNIGSYDKLTVKLIKHFFPKYNWKRHRKNKNISKELNSSMMVFNPETIIKLTRFGLLRKMGLMKPARAVYDKLPENIRLYIKQRVK